MSRGHSFTTVDHRHRDRGVGAVWAGVVASTEEVGGKYCEDCNVGELIAGDSQLSVIARGVRGYALDPEKAKALWKKSEEMVGESFA
jgi:hypothetical protein